MPKDYAKKTKRKKPASRGQSTRRKKPQKSPPWLWLVCGLFLGLFFAGLFYIKEHHANTYKRYAQKAHLIKSEKKSSKKEQQPKQPRYDFYTLLPKMKVWVPNPNNQAQKATSKQPPVPMAYVVQLASFKAFKDADHLKATLTLQGFNAIIKPRKSKNETWNRVWLGPYQTQAAAEKAQQQLAKKYPQSLLLKVPA